MEHLAIMDKDTIIKIINGTKTIESRFSINKISPYHRVNIGDLVYLKETGKNIIAVFTVEKVQYFEDLTPLKIRVIKEQYNKYVNAPDSYWKLKEKANYGTFIYIKNPHYIAPINIYKRGRQAFITVKSISGDLSSAKNIPDKNAFDCQNDLHNFNNSTRNKDGQLYCSVCNENIVNWKLLYSLSNDFDAVLKELLKDKWHYDWLNIKIDNIAINQLNNNDIDNQIRKRLVQSIGKYNSKIDGKQTPFAGNIIYYAQHATGTCCRKCLEKWYGIPKTKKLTNKEIDYFASIIKRYIKRRNI